MRTLGTFRPGGYSVPGGTAWYLVELGEFRGKQELYTRQSPQAQLEQACPGVSREMLRKVLGDQKGKTVECVGRGPGARWVKKG